MLLYCCIADEKISHVITRGNNQQVVFLKNRDRIRYLKRLEEYSNKYEVRIISYCLMSNHIHLLLKETGFRYLPKFMQALNTSYTKYFNIRYKRSGHLFQGRYKSIPIETDEQLIHVSRYIHLNPVAANLTTKPEIYEWSSYKDYLQTGTFSFVKKEIILNYFASKHSNSDYKNFVEAQTSEAKERQLAKIFMD